MIRIIIPSPGYTSILQTCIDSIEKFTKTDDYEILIINTKSKEDDPQTEANIKSKYSNVKTFNLGFYHFATVNNKAVFEYYKDIADTDFICFCNSDIEFTSDCISEMSNLLKQSEEIGTVGAFLIFPDGTIQHAGVGLEPKSINCYHIGYKQPEDSFAPQSQYGLVYANTAALLMIRNSVFKKLNGFNQEFKICFEDLDLNLRAVKDLNLKNFICYNARAIHNESSTRGKGLDALDYWKIRIAMAEFMYWLEEQKHEKA